MTRQEFERLAQEGVVILDGATGSNYRLAGMPVGVCTEQWAAEHPEVVQKLQRDYIDAGSQIVYAPTFGANRIGLSIYGLEDRLEALKRELKERFEHNRDAYTMAKTDFVREHTEKARREFGGRYRPPEEGAGV